MVHSAQGVLDLSILLASRPVWRVLSVLLRPPFVPHRLREFEAELAMSRSSLQRGLKALIAAGLADHRRGQYRANVSVDGVRYLWLLMQFGRYQSLPAPLRNALALILNRDFEEGDCAVVFGSWARGKAVPGESDVDVAVFLHEKDGASRQLGAQRVFEGQYRIDLHSLRAQEMQHPDNTVALDALLNGVAVTRRELVYHALVDLRSFPKAFLVNRLRQAMSFRDRAALLQNHEEASEFFSQIAERTIAQVDSILEHGRTTSWREREPRQLSDAMLRDLEASLAQEGETIWLT